MLLFILNGKEIYCCIERIKVLRQWSGMEQGSSGLRLCSGPSLLRFISRDPQGKNYNEERINTSVIRKIKGN